MIEDKQLDDFALTDHPSITGGGTLENPPENTQITKKQLAEKFSSLLVPQKVIRDPVHGDIQITELEVRILDNIYFQRLRKIRQLGTTHLIYPGANHSRFEHSIGTLHIAKKIINSVNKNWRIFKFDGNIPFSDAEITPDKEFIIRIVALLHDAAHIAFGHTLEQEGLLFNKKKQWLDSKRKDIIWNNFSKIIKNYLEEKNFSMDDIEQTIKDIESVLIAEESGEKQICELKDPYIADIVGNTICADLLDYLRRDAYFSGLCLSYDSRLFSYFILKSYSSDPNEEDITKKKMRLAILLEKNKGIRRDILSECVDLLRLRYSLAERVYYHRAKIITSAMVIKMVYCAQKGKILNCNEKSNDYLNELLFWGDDALICNIQNYKNKNNNEDIASAQRIAKGLANRHLYKIIFPMKEPYIYTIVNMKKVKPYLSPSKRYAFERKIEEYAGLPAGSIILYVTKKDLGKTADAKVFLKSSDTVVSLKELVNEQEPEYISIGEEIKAINSRYSLLWGVFVLIDRDVQRSLKDRDLQEYLEKFCEEFINKRGIYEGVRIRAKILHDEEKLEIPINIVDNIARELVAQHSDPRDISVNYINTQLKNWKNR
jgi:hypothetical protein